MEFLSVLALIGKIIGFTLLGILAFVLLIVLLVLFVPIRYRINGDGEKSDAVMRAAASGRATWLLHLISVRADFLLDKPAGGGEQEEEAPEGGTKLDYGVKLLGIRIFPKKNCKKTEPDPAPAEAEDIPADEGEIAEMSFDDTDAGSVHGSDDTVNPAETTDGQAEKVSERPEQEEKQSLPERLAQKYGNITAKIEELYGKYEKLRGFAEDSEVREELGTVLGRLGRMFKHYVPDELSGRVRLGLSDPATTGKILGAYYSMIFPKFGSSMSLTGDFENEIIEGGLAVAGHIRLNHAAAFALRMIIDRRFKKVLRRAKKLKEEL